MHGHCSHYEAWACINDLQPMFRPILGAVIDLGPLYVTVLGRFWMHALERSIGRQGTFSVRYRTLTESYESIEDIFTSK
jgi:hypothetical protein